MVTHIDLELRKVKKERDIYRQAIVDCLDSYYVGEIDMKVLVDALGKKRMER